MKMRFMVQMVGAIALTAVLALGPTTHPAAADPADVWLPAGTWSKQYNLGGCLYKLVWGTYGSPFVAVRFYNLSACGGAVAIVQYDNGQIAGSSAIQTTGTDGCGAFQQIHAVGPLAGTAERALVWLGTGYRWYDDDGLAAQPINSHC
jgi:hypothetical protein